MYLFFSLVVLLLSVILTQKYNTSLRLTELNFGSYIFYYELILQTFISSLLVIYNIDNHYIISSVASDKSRFYGWISIQWCMLTLPLGFLIGKLFTKIKNTNNFFRGYCYKRLSFFSKNYEFCLYVVLMFLTLTSFGVTLLYSYIIGGIGIIQLIIDPTIIEGSFRIDVSKGFTGILMYLRNIFSIGLSPILTLIWYTYYKRKKNKKILLIFICSFICTIIALTNNLAKAPLFFFLMKFIFIYVLINGKIKKKLLFISGSLILISLICIYLFILKVPLTSLLDYNSGILGRLLLSQSAGLYCSFEYFPSSVEHLNFSSFPQWFTSLFNLDVHDRSSRICMEIFNPVGVNNNTAGVMNSIFLAESWANWGWLGVFISPIFVGIFIHVFFYLFFKLPKHPIFVALIAYYSNALPITGGINDFIIPTGILILVMIIFFVFFIGDFIKSAVKRRYS